MEARKRIIQEDLEKILGNRKIVIARELTTPPIERKKPIIFDWFSGKKKKEDK